MSSFTNLHPSATSSLRKQTLINPNSLKVIHAKAEPSLKGVLPGETFQFQRKGYFIVDKKTKTDKIVFNKTVGLRDSWKK